MQRVTVDSSMISSVGYDDQAQELEIEFNTGKIYRYQEVPKEIYEGLLAAESKGSYMHGHVIDCYPYYQVTKRHRR